MTLFYVVTTSFGLPVIFCFVLREDPARMCPSGASEQWWLWGGGREAYPPRSCARQASKVRPLLLSIRAPGGDRPPPPAGPRAWEAPGVAARRAPSPGDGRGVDARARGPGTRARHRARTEGSVGAGGGGGGGRGGPFTARPGRTGRAEGRA